MPTDRPPSPLRTVSQRPLWWLSCLVLALGGCSSLWRGSSEESDEKARLRELLTAPEPPKLIRDAAVPYGLHPIEVEGVAAINGLPGTGGAPDPSPFRDQLLQEMKRENVRDANLFLESSSTSLVRVKTVIPPGARRGDPLDLLVTAPPQSRASDLHGGWMLNTRLRQQQVIGNALRQSDVKAIGIGPVLTRATHDPEEDPTHRLEGRVLSGGRVQVDRQLGLVLRPDYKHAKVSAELANAINRRFFFFDGTTRRGIAKPVEDDFIELDIHPRYRRNEYRMIEVVRAVSGRVETASSQTRLAELAQQLTDPATAFDAALQLEAIGDSAVPTLIAGLESDNPELRFYAAQSLAYLDREESIEPLAEAARQTPAFRQPALLALQGFDQPMVVDALRQLLDESSLETRYGAFCAIRRRPEGRLQLPGETVGDTFRLYRVASPARPAVVVSLRETPEIVLFGSVAPLEIPDFLFGPAGILIKPSDQHPGQLRISRFQPGQEDRRVLTSTAVDEVIKGIAAVGGGYGDVVAVLRVAKSKGFLADQLAFDPLPEPMRTYYREEGEEGNEEGPTAEEERDTADEVTGLGV